MIRTLLTVVFLTCATSAFAQPLGTFRWQLQPYCNVLTLAVTRNGAVYALEGTDDQCGAPKAASAVGAAFLNPDGSVGLGLTIVEAPGGAPVHVQVDLNMATLGGTWRDSQGHTGTLVFNPAAAPAGNPRPASAPFNQFAAGLVAGQTTFSADGGFVAGGTFGVGSPGATGAGVRTMWYPAKGAFRAGRANGNEWDAGNIGDFSVAMGSNVWAVQRGAIALGENVTARASGVALGSDVSADFRGVALGHRAFANHAGAMVFGDASDAIGSELNSTAANQFSARAQGGYRLFSDAFRNAGVTLAPGASAWASVSDVNMKENFRDLDGRDVLAKIAHMPIREWNYKTQDASIRHAGPTAQDFHAAFGLGEDPLRISTIDADGIALAAIRALTLENQTLKAALAALSERIDQLEVMGGKR